MSGPQWLTRSVCRSVPAQFSGMGVSERPLSQESTSVPSIRRALIGRSRARSSHYPGGCSVRFLRRVVAALATSFLVALVVQVVHAAPAQAAQVDYFRLQRHADRIGVDNELGSSLHRSGVQRLLDNANNTA